MSGGPYNPLPTLSNASGTMGGGSSNMVLPLGSAILGGYQLWWGNKELNKLGERPNYQVNPQLNTMANESFQNRNQGYSDAQIDAFMQNLAGMNNTNYNRGMQASGGNQSQVIRAILSGQSNNALNQFAANDAAIQKQNYQIANQLQGQVQQQNNLITQQDIQDWIFRKMDARASKNAGMTTLAQVGDIAATQAYQQQKDAAAAKAAVGLV
jgi:hypothetical protein